MGTYHFSGVIHPARSDFVLPRGTFTFALETEGLEGEATLQGFYSMVSVVVSVGGEPNILTLRNVVHGLVQANIDAYGYVSGRGFRAEIVSVLSPDGQMEVFGCGVPVLESTVEERPIDIAAILTLSYESRWVRRMLADLSLAIREPIDSGFYLYRAIEAIRQHFQERANGENQAWERLRRELKVRRESLEEIKSFADEPRHGSWAQISDQQSARILSLAWEIAFRFCNYLLGTPVTDVEI